MKIIELVLFGAFLFGYIRSEQHLHTVEGDVGRGNYTYYSLMYEGPISLFLHSTQGDADLYVSQINSKPTYEPETYCLQSSTCGLDVVHIPSDFNRPVGIGVYGHPSYATSSYSLEVFVTEIDLNDSSSSYPDPDSGLAERRWQTQEADSGADYYTHQQKDRSVKDEDKPQEESVIWNLVLSFIDILIDVLVL